MDHLTGLVTLSLDSELERKQSQIKATFSWIVQDEAVKYEGASRDQNRKLLVSTRRTGQDD